MRIFLISTLLLFMAAFIHTAVLADVTCGTLKTIENIDGSDIQGVTLSGQIIPKLKGPPANRFDPNSILVRFKQNASFDEKARGRQTIKGKKLRGYSVVKGLEHLSIGIPGLEVEEAVKIMKQLPFVEYAQPNYVISINATIPDDATFSEQWALDNYGQQSSWPFLWGPGADGADIDAPEAWDIITYSNTVVAIMDTGITYDHPDLEDNIWINPGETPDNGIDDDGNGYIDDIHGWDFVNNDNKPYDDHGHGSHVAGIIAAKGNNGISSVIPNLFAPDEIGVSGVLWNGHLMAVKIMDANGYGVLSDAIAALEYAEQMGARISNNSWGYYESDLLDEDEWVAHSALYDTIASTNTSLFIAAAGNYGVNTDVTPHYPSSFNLDNIISVAATDYNDSLAVFSNYGMQSVDLAAPGVQIFNTWTWTYSFLDDKSYADYAWLDGTSMAAPHVAGVAAMIAQLHPDWAVEQLKSLILGTVRPLTMLSGNTVTGGIVNAANAVEESNIPPTANFSYLTEDLDVGFTDGSEDYGGGSIVFWDWDFGDNVFSNAQNPTHTYADYGTYDVTLKVTDNEGFNGEKTQRVSVTGSANIPLNAPTNLSATVKASTVSLGWDDTSNDESGFIVERAQKIRGKYDFVKIGGAGSDATSYEDTGVSPGSYKYRVQAYKSLIYSEYSNEVFVKVEEIASDCNDGLCNGNETPCTCPEDCGSPEPSETSCSDGIDNDCDDLVDCLDPDCECPECLDTGAECTANDECCSNRCHPVQKVCK